MKSLFALPLIILTSLSPLFAEREIGDDFTSDQFILQEVSTNEYKIVGVAEDFIEETELRIYDFDDKKIISIDENAFASATNLESIMISNKLTNFSISENAFNGLDKFKTINYTGSLEEFEELEFTNDKITINDYACDEGFMNFWNKFIRPTSDSSLCDVSKENYLKVQALFDELSLDDKDRVKDIEDGDGTINDALNYLKDYHKEHKQDSRPKEVSKSTMIVLILVIASIGMSFICIFYLLRERKIIS